MILRASMLLQDFPECLRTAVERLWDVPGVESRASWTRIHVGALVADIEGCGLRAMSGF